MPNPTPLKDLANFMNKQVIPCIEVTLASLKPDIKRGTGEYGDYAYQSGSFKDAQGGSAYFSFSGNDDCFFKSSDVGTKIRIECGTDKKGAPAGLVWGVRPSGDKTYTTINLDNRAKISYFNGQGSPSHGAPTQGRAVSVQSGGSQAGLDQSPVRERVHCYFEVLKEVSAQYKHLQSTAEQDGIKIPALTASDIKDITTHLSMTYRGEFGSYAKPIFQQEKKPSPQVEEPQDQGGGLLEGDDIPFAPAWKSLGSGVF